MNNLAKYKDGVPALGLPPLDPLDLPRVALELGGNSVEFYNVVARGLSDFTVNSISFDEASDSIRMKISYPRVSTQGNYTLEALNTKSSGPYKNVYKDIVAEGSSKLARNGNSITIADTDIKISVGVINVNLECLFPPEDEPNKCCPDKAYKSCVPILAQTIHRAINKNGRGGLVERFQPQISKMVGDVFKEFFNRSLKLTDGSFL